MHRGWVRLYRKLQDNPFWTEEQFTRGQAWVDLILIANYKDGHVRVRGVQKDVKRGQVGYSEDTLASRWDWSRGKVRRFMSELTKMKMIVQQKSRLLSIITILNYDEHQANGTTDSTTDSTTDGQQTVQQTVQQTDTNNKDKKVKKVKKVKKQKQGGAELRKEFGGEHAKHETLLNAWERWQVHRIEIKKKLTPSTMSGQIEKLEKVSPDIAVSMIDQSIDNGWTGLFPIRNNQAKDKTQSNISNADSWLKKSEGQDAE